MIKLKLLSRNAENFITCNYKSDFIQYENIKQQVSSFSFGGCYLNLVFIIFQLLIDAKECLNVLSSKLDSRTFMFENQ